MKQALPPSKRTIKGFDDANFSEYKPLYPIGDFYDEYLNKSAQEKAEIIFCPRNEYFWERSHEALKKYHIHGSILADYVTIFMRAMVNSFNVYKTTSGINCDKIVFKCAVHQRGYTRASRFSASEVVKTEKTMKEEKILKTEKAMKIKTTVADKESITNAEKAVDTENTEKTVNGEDITLDTEKTGPAETEEEKPPPKKIGKRRSKYSLTFDDPHVFVQSVSQAYVQSISDEPCKCSYKLVFQHDGEGFYQLVEYGKLSCHTQECLDAEARVPKSVMDYVLKYAMIEGNLVRGCFKARHKLEVMGIFCGHSLSNLLHRERKENETEYENLTKANVKSTEVLETMKQLKSKDEQTQLLISALYVARKRANAMLDMHVTEEAIFVAAFITPQQLELIKWHGDVLYVDAIHVASTERQKLLTVVVTDRNDYNRLAAQALSIEESCVVYEKLFRLIKNKYYEMFKEHYAPQIIVADGHEGLHKAVTNIFGKQVMHIYCAFHLRINLMRNCATYFPSLKKEEREKLRSALITALTIWNKTAYSYSIAEIRRFHEAQTALYSTSEGSAYKQLETTCSHIDDYVRLIQTQSPHAIQRYIGASVASSRVESENKILRVMGITARHHTWQVVTTVLELIDMEKEMKQKPFKHDAHREVVALLHPDALKKLTPGILFSFNKNFLASRKYKMIDDSTLQHVDYFKVINPEPKPKGNYKPPIRKTKPEVVLKEATYKYCIALSGSIYRCDCHKDVASGRPCAHLIRYFIEKKMQFTLDYFHPRFLRISTLENMPTDDDNVPDGLVESSGELIPICNVSGEVEMWVGENDVLRQTVSLSKDLQGRKKTDYMQRLANLNREFAATPPGGSSIWNQGGNTSTAVVHYGTCVNKTFKH